MAQRILLPYEYYPDPNRGRPLFNAKIYIGEVNKDPELNPVQAYAVADTGTLEPITQPILTSSGGVPLVAGSPAILAADGPYSMRVRDSNDAEVYYAPDSEAGGGAGGGGGGDFIPLSGTELNRPVTGLIEFDEPGSNGAITQDQVVNFLGAADAMVWRAQGVNTGFVFAARNVGGVEQAFSFTSTGNFVLPSQEESNTESWSIGATTLFGVPNTLLFVAQDIIGNQVSRNIAFSVAPDLSFVFHEDPGNGSTRGYLQLPRSTVDTDDPLAATTKDYVDGKIPSGGGEENTASNLPGGQGVFAQKAAVDLQFKSLIGGTDITLVSDANTITINSTASGGGGDFIPLSGTLPGTPVNGRVEFEDGTSNIRLMGGAGLSFGSLVPNDPVVDVVWQSTFGRLGFVPTAGIPTGYAFGCHNGTSQSTVNMDVEGRIIAGSRTIGAVDESVLTLGWWKDDVLNAANVNFGGAVNALELSSGTNITAFGSIESEGGQFFLRAAQGAAADTLTKREYVDGLDAGNVKTTGNQQISGIKDFNSRIDANAGVRSTGKIDCTVEIEGASVAAENLQSSPGANLIADPSGFGFIVAQLSDIRLKTNVTDNPYGLNTILGIDTIRFNWKEGSTQPEVGFSAQQLLEVLPEAVVHNEDADSYALKDGPIIATLVKALQEAHERIERLEAILIP